MPETAEKPTVTVSHHAIKRYWERFPASNSLTEEEVTTEIQTRYERAAFILKGTTSAHGEATFYLDDDLVIVVKEANITILYPATYGFGADIDDTIRRKLLRSVTRLQELVHRAAEKLRTGQAGLMREIETIDTRIALLEAEIQLQKDAKATLIAQQSKMHSEKSLLNVQLAAEADKLVMSQRYALETLATVQSIARGTKASGK